VANIKSITMNNTLKFIFFLCSLAYSGFCFGQTPPPPAVAKTEQQKLIREFLEVSDYKEAVLHYAQFYLEMKMYSYKGGIKKQNFTEKQASKILKDFDFKDFEFSIISSLSFISVEKLEDLIIFYKKIGGSLSSDHSLLIFSPSLRLNLENQLSFAIEELKK